MLKNYLKTTLRTYAISKKIGNRSLFTYINLLGLVIGLAAFLVIAHIVRYELSYDNFFANASSLYRVKVEKIENGQTTMASAKTYPAVGNILKTQIPEVRSFARVLAEECMLHYKEKNIKFNRQSTYWADKSFIAMFGLKLIETGDTSSFDKPFNSVLSQSAAERFFGTDWSGENTPIGKTIRLNESLPFIVQGVYRDLPSNSHMKVDFIVSYSTLVNLVGVYHDNGMPPSYNATYTYILLEPGIPAEKIEERARKALVERIPASVRAETDYRFSLQPVSSIHLDSDLADELNPNGNRTFVAAMSVAAALILLVAWINFINLATARAMQRAREIGVRKAIGSSRKQLIQQFIFEALFATVLAAIGAIIVVFSISGYIKNMAGIESSIFTWKGQGLYSWLFFIGIILTGGLLSSIYPAMILSSFKPIDVLKGKAGTTPGKGYLRKGLITFQFFFAVFLL